jgi:hypothetical protein
VDDAETMLKHWDEATFVLETLVLKAHGQDPDGLDLAFTSDSSELKKEKDAAAFHKAMHRLRPKPMHHVHTNIKRSLEPIFNEYRTKVQYTSNKSKVPALTVIVLTDGLWEGMGNKHEIIIKVVDFYSQVKQTMNGMMGDRQVSIQFIQLGDNEEAQERLRYPDDNIEYHGVGKAHSIAVMDPGANPCL